MFRQLDKQQRYTESATQSAELLRLVIPQISKHQLAANPVNYTVWYEYYRATHPQLNQAIDDVVGSGKGITNELMESFFNAYIAVPSPENLKQTQVDILRLINTLSETAKTTDSTASIYQQSLQTCGDQLESPTANQELPLILNKLIHETQNMQYSLQAMRSHMDESQQEIIELRNKLDQAIAETLSDVLTGLANRKGFSKALKKALTQAEETHSSTALLMADIDHFKKVNDTHGHLLGDKVIKFVADTLTMQIKGQDTASRFGGEEFAVLLPNTSLQGAQAIAETIRNKIEKARIFRTNSREPIGKITISIGIANYRPHEAIEAFIDRADSALYLSKQNGRNRVTIEN
ncbi:MAG: GGDEF domain-containing protein [Methylococcales bacterium]